MVLIIDDLFRTCMSTRDVYETNVGSRLFRVPVLNVCRRYVIRVGALPGLVHDFFPGGPWMGMDTLGSKNLLGINL